MHILYTKSEKRKIPNRRKNVYRLLFFVVLFATAAWIRLSGVLEPRSVSVFGWMGVDADEMFQAVSSVVAQNGVVAVNGN